MQKEKFKQLQIAKSLAQLKNPSEKLQLEVVKIVGFSIQYIENPSEKVKLAAVEQNGWAIQYIKTPSKEVQLEAINQCPDILNNINRYIKNPCEEILDLLMIKDIIE